MQLGLRQALPVAAVVVVILAGLLAFWLVDNYVTGASQASPAISLDVEPSGNTATSAASVDVCRSAATETSFDVDVVVQDVQGLDGYQLDLLYSPSLLKVTGLEPGLFLGSGGISFAGSAPDSDGVLALAYADMLGPSRSGSGALARVTFQTVGSGVARVRLANVMLVQSGGEALGDRDGDDLFDGPLPDAFVAVDQPCPSADAVASGALETAPLPEAPSRVPQGQPPALEPSPTPLAIPTATPAPYREPKLVQSASPEIVYPPKLERLPSSIRSLAADPATGDLWFPVLGESAPPFQGLSSRIYRYSPASDKLDFWELAVEPYTGSVVDMTIGPQANVWLTWGYNIVKFDTSTLSATVYPLGEEVQYPRAGAPDPGSQVSALAVDAAGKVWFTRRNDAAILELDPASGGVREQPVPAYFAPPLVSRMAVDGQGQLWLPGTVPAGSDEANHLGQFDTTTGAFALHDVTVQALAVDGDGQVWLTGGSEGGLQKLDRVAGQASVVADAPIGGPLQDWLIADPKTGNLWLSSFGEGKIGRYSPNTGEAIWYTLPVVEIDTSIMTVPYGVEPRGAVEVRPTVAGMAVDGDGNLWFAAGQSIGMIPAP